MSPMTGSTTTITNTVNAAPKTTENEKVSYLLICILWLI